MVDSHLMLLAATIHVQIRRNSDPEKVGARRDYRTPEYPGTLWRLRKLRTAYKGAQQKE
jgi:hypothetical protein